MKSEYSQVRPSTDMNSTDGVKSAEGDNIKYPRVKKAFQVEQPTVAL